MKWNLLAIATATALVLAVGWIEVESEKYEESAKEYYRTHYEPVEILTENKIR